MNYEFVTAFGIGVVIMFCYQKYKQYKNPPPLPPTEEELTKMRAIRKQWIEESARERNLLMIALKKSFNT